MNIFCARNFASAAFDTEDSQGRWHSVSLKEAMFMSLTESARFMIDALLLELIPTLI